MIFGIAENLWSRRLVLVLVMACFCALAALLPARAAQMNELRPGGDYDYLTTPAGAGYRWCEQRCRDDARCKAWTFLKASGQCRLKRFAAPAQANDCCISGTSEAVGPRSARQVCADYANEAVAAQEANLGRRCGLAGKDWSDDFKGHFAACLDMPAGRRTWLGQWRSQSLRLCDAKSAEKDGACRRFAAQAEEIDRLGAGKDCRLEARPWQGGRALAFAWCKEQAGEIEETVLAATQQELAACLERGGGPASERCDRYATEAVGQFAEARKAECGVSGSQWSETYRDHFQRCLAADDVDLRNESAARRDELDLCRGEGGASEQGRLACEHFARLANQQTLTNQERGCGLKGRRWLADYDRQFAWCISTSKANREQELAYRETELERCFQRGGGVASEACDTYARTALTQNRQNADWSCGFRGPDWHERYIGHYRWCLGAKSGAAVKKQWRRGQALESCRIGVKLPLARR